MILVESNVGLQPKFGESVLCGIGERTGVNATNRVLKIGGTSSSGEPADNTLRYRCEPGHGRGITGNEMSAAVLYGPKHHRLVAQLRCQRSTGRSRHDSAQAKMRC